MSKFKSKLKFAALAMVGLLALLLLLVAARPGTFRVQRATTIQAPPETIFAFINDFHRWGSWSPYEKLDPKMKRVYSGAASGKDAVYEWNGNSDAGAGRMEIKEAKQPSRITIQLDFLKPFQAHNIAEFTLEPHDDTTKLTWAMHGPMPYMAKLMGLFFSMDDLVGKDFETGLANLKALAEK